MSLESPTTGEPSRYSNGEGRREGASNSRSFLNARRGQRGQHVWNSGDRTHRIGQTSKVMAYRLLMRESIEVKIRALQRQKAALVQDVLGEERFAQNLTLEDLKFLFAD